ncbi:hypothetical protein [Edaphobacter modestus]|uniref:Uncharacterized protein n=1 Tax=Edaphobacter modestus TaxID=388466 RepID=A0A4Q7YRU6_9BACT|nr:hypothetical protein [Edaphobacter modestus]RZU39904.1 hypothetical protein BDD14_1304 [Edaphobacter modestus]
MSRISTIGKLLLVIPLIAGPFAPTPAAQAQEDVTASVPFEFSVNNQRMVAGKYQIKLVSNRFLVLHDASTGKSQFLMVSPAWVDVIQSRGRLVFHRYGSSHYLFQVWIPGRSGYSEFMPTRSERQTMLAAKMPFSHANVVAALSTPTQ